MLHICWLNIHDGNFPVSPHPKGPLLDYDLVTLSPFEYSELTVKPVNQFQMIWTLWLWCFIRRFIVHTRVMVRTRSATILNNKQYSVSTKEGFVKPGNVFQSPFVKLCGPHGNCCLCCLFFSWQELHPMWSFADVEDHTYCTPKSLHWEIMFFFLISDVSQCFTATVFSCFLFISCSPWEMHLNWVDCLTLKRHNIVLQNFQKFSSFSLFQMLLATANVLIFLKLNVMDLFWLSS